MARPKQKTAFLGEQTVRILLGVPTKQAGWLIHALCDWIENHREPQDGEIPAPCIGAWIAIRDESVRIHESRKQQAKAGQIGGKANPKRITSEPEANPKRTATKIESKSNIVSSPSNEGSLTARDPGEEFIPSYIVDDWAALKMQASNVGLTDAQLDAWRDYYAAQGWRFKPTAPAPMNRTEALASVRNWARAEKRLEIRAMQRDPSKFAPPPDKGGIDTAALGI